MNVIFVREMLKLPNYSKFPSSFQQWFGTKGIQVFAGIGITLLAVWLHLTAVETVQLWLNYLDNSTYDLRLRYSLPSKGQQGSNSKSPIVIVDIDDQSLAKEGRWPWTRSKIAFLVDKIKESGAAVVALDIMFPEQEQNTVDLLKEKLKNQNIKLPSDMDQFFQKAHQDIDADRSLITSLSKLDSVLGFVFHDNPDESDQGMLPPPLLTLSESFLMTSSIPSMRRFMGNTTVIQEQIKHGGFINAFPDMDGNIRKASLAIRYGDNLYGSLSLQATLLYLLTNHVSVALNDSGTLEGLIIDKTLIRTSPKGTIYIPFRGKAGSYPYISATDLMENKIDKKHLAGKLVFVGTSATGMGDLKGTAVDSVYPGVEVHATVADGILKNDLFYKPVWDNQVITFVIIFIGLLTAIGWAYLTPKWLSFCTFLFITSLLGVNQYLWSHYHLVLSFILPILTVLSIFFINLSYGYFQESRRRLALKEMFSQYVPPAQVDKMIKASIAQDLAGENREMTVLFADIRGFTSITENLSAGEVKNILNEYLTPMTQIIFDHGGTIDKYVGDLIMAFWGAPLDDPDHVRHALKAALAMQKKLKFMVFYTEKDHDEIRIRIGIGLNSGPMNVGDMGSKFRRAYTVLGDSVNLASRLESSSKFYGAKIIVGEKTHDGQPDFLFRKIDLVRVKGKQFAINAFELLCSMSEASPELIAEVETYHKALDYYYHQNWKEAHSLFMQLLENQPESEFPETHLYKIYLSRIEDFRKNPPPSDWDGVYTREEK